MSDSAVFHQLARSAARRVPLRSPTGCLGRRRAGRDHFRRSRRVVLPIRASCASGSSRCAAPDSPNCGGRPGAVSTGSDRSDPPCGRRRTHRFGVLELDETRARRHRRRRRSGVRVAPRVSCATARIRTCCACGTISTPSTAARATRNATSSSASGAPPASAPGRTDGYPAATVIGRRDGDPHSADLLAQRPRRGHSPGKSPADALHIAIRASTGLARRSSRARCWSMSSWSRSRARRASSGTPRIIRAISIRRSMKCSTISAACCARRPAAAPSIPRRLRSAQPAQDLPARRRGRPGGGREAARAPARRNAAHHSRRRCLPRGSARRGRRRARSLILSTELESASDLRTAPDAIRLPCAPCPAQPSQQREHQPQRPGEHQHAIQPHRRRNDGRLRQQPQRCDP